MTPFSYRFAKWVLIVLASLTVLLLIAGVVLSRYASRAVHSRLEAFGGKSSDVNVNLFTKSLSVNQLELSVRSDSGDHIPTKARVQTILVKNIDLYHLLFDNELRIKEISIEDGDIELNRKVSLTDSSATIQKNSLKGVYVERFILKAIHLSIVSDTSKEYSGTVDITLNKIQSSDTADVYELNAYTLESVDAKVTNLFIAASNLYDIEVKQVNVRSESKELEVDSLILLPKYPKDRFSRVAGKQIDRVNTFIRHIKVSNLQFNQLRDSSFSASKIVIDSAEVYSFRDKRMPFKEIKNKPLPIAAIKKMDFGLEIDTIQIKNSKITYDEFAEEGFESGKVTFENLNATLNNVNNRPYYNKPGHATLTASAKLMGEGIIEATFILPFEQDKPYQAKGKIGKFTLQQLNPPLENLAFVNIESGTLNRLDFAFEYTDDVSNGTVTINYENLKINGLKKQKSSVINELKTLLINTIVKNDKDSSVSAEKRTGTINFERDKKRQIFNYWWKSLFSGIKSSVIEN